MTFYWLCYRHNNQTCVLIEPALLAHARSPPSYLDGLGQGEFTEGHKLDRKWKIAKEMIGRRLKQGEAKRLLKNSTDPTLILTNGESGMWSGNQSHVCLPDY
jgi:hypothetical protein